MGWASRSTGMMDSDGLDSLVQGNDSKAQGLGLRRAGLFSLSFLFSLLFILKFPFGKVFYYVLKCTTTKIFC